MLATMTSRVRPAAELMRLPLALTAISNTQAGYLLFSSVGAGVWTWPLAAVLGGMSLGLYGFGMVSNDIVDLRRDRYLAPHRPLPSGRIGLLAAHLLAGILLLVGLGCGLTFAVMQRGTISAMFFLAWTVLLIVFYNIAGKFVGAVGIVTLGLIRFFHASVAQPHLGVVWHPLLLMDHVILVTALCYVLEGKRPRLSISHRGTIVVSLLALNIFFVSGILLATWLRLDEGGDLLRAMGLTQSLMPPLVAAGVFAVLAFALVLPLRTPTSLTLRQQMERRRRTGRRLMVLGLLWLVIYDATFIFGFLF